MAKIKSAKHKDLDQIRRESLKLYQAIRYIKIKEDCSDKDVYKIIQEKKKKAGSTTLNKLKNACNNDEYAKLATLQALKRVLDVIQPYILEKYRAKWHDDEDDFFDDEEFKNIVSRSAGKERLDGLLGKWIGYGYNKDNSTGEKHIINIFKFDITGFDNISCYTAVGNFEEGKIESFRYDCFEMQLKNKTRKIILFGLIGHLAKEQLASKSKILLTYIDTGKSRLKAGVALMVRASEEFDRIHPETKELESITDAYHLKLIKDYLLNTQFVINL